MTQAKLRLFGPDISTYGRICAIVAEEAGLAWENVPQPSGRSQPGNRHPFGKTPWAEIDGALIYESAAITRYIDRRYNAGALQPTDPLAGARMVQWIAVGDNYLFPLSDAYLVLPRLIAPAMGRVADETQIARAVPVIDRHLSELEARLSESAWFAGEALSLADLHLYPIVRAIALTPEGRAMIASKPKLADWLDTLGQRPSIAATAWPGESPSA